MPRRAALLIAATSCVALNNKESFQATLAAKSGSNAPTPSPVAPPYSETLALRYTHLAGAAYCDPYNIHAWNCSVHCAAVPDISVEHVLIDTDKNLQGYVGIDKSSNTIILSFRGTEETSFENWMENLDALTTSPFSATPDVDVHKGFWGNYLALRTDIIETLQHDADGRDIVVTGHSMGAAIAVLAAYDLKVNYGYSVPYVYTVGQPRTGNKDFHSALANAVPHFWRIVHAADPVPHVPPEGSYVHVPTEVWYQDEAYVAGKYKICDGSGEDTSCSDSLSVFKYKTSDHLTYLGIKLGSGC